MAESHCRARDERGDPAETDGFLCFWCLEGATHDIRGLALDYYGLEQHLAPSLGVWGSGMPSGKGAPARLPLNEHALSLQQDIWFLTDAWDAVARDLDRLSDKPTRTRAGWAVQQSVSILAPRLDRLARATGTMWDYPGWELRSGERAEEIPGWQGVLDLSKLHYAARDVLGLGNDRGEACIGVICPECGIKSKLVRDVEHGGVNCKACKTVLTATEYAEWVGELHAEAIREEAA